MADKMNNQQGAPEVMETLSKSEDFILKYKNLLIGGVVAILVLVAGYFTVKHFTHESFQKASTAMAKAQEYYSDAVLSDDAALFNKALNGDSLGNVGFLAIASDYSGKAANLANLYAGICYARLGNWEEAANYIKKFDGDDEMVAPAAIGALGNVQASLGQLDEAVSTLKKAASKADNAALSPQFLIQAAEILESQGKKDEALKLYEQVKADYPEYLRFNNLDNFIERVK
jgi:tetratricopeptide (TPR) repeat protein